MRKRKIRRYGVDAVFSDGVHVILRDFAKPQDAVRWLEGHQGVDLYPGRVYRMEIVPFEVDDADVSLQPPSRRPRR
jgi:hypothetical protein